MVFGTIEWQLASVFLALSRGKAPLQGITEVIEINN